MTFSHAKFNEFPLIDEASLLSIHIHRVLFLLVIVIIVVIVDHIAHPCHGPGDHDVHHGIKHEVDGGVQHECSQGEEGEYP